jgi:hypothetical protein
MKILKISKLNKFYDSNKHLEDTEFLNAILDDLDINLKFRKISNAYLKMALTSLSNHPLGGIDGVLLLKLMLEKSRILKSSLISFA